MGLCENVTKLRALSGLTQEKFGEVAGVSRAAVSQWEGNRAEPRMGAIERLRMHFGIRKADLVEDGGMDSAYVTKSGRIAFADDEDGFSHDEQELIALFRSTDQRGRDVILAVARSQAGDAGQLESVVAC